MGINIAPTPFSLSAPGTTGQSIAWLVEAAFQEADVNPTVLPYYNAANPITSPGWAPRTPARHNRHRAYNACNCKFGQVQLLPAATQVPPQLDAGWVGIAVVTVPYGQTAIDASNIAPYIRRRL